MKAKMVKHQYLRNKWAPIISECKSSGMTVRFWCQIKHINEKQFYYWQRRLREELYTASFETKKLNLTPTFIPVPNEIFSNLEPYKTPSVYIPTKKRHLHEQESVSRRVGATLTETEPIKNL